MRTATSTRLGTSVLAAFMLVITTLAYSYASSAAPIQQTGLRSLGTFILSTTAIQERTMTTTNSGNKPTIVLVHGAFADSSSWNGVMSELLTQGYPVVAAANPLRGVKSDAAYLASLLKEIQGPIVLVGHSYGGVVITNAASGNRHVKALVYVAGFTPDAGESAAELAARYPGGTLGEALAPPVTLPDGGKDLYIQLDKFRDQFAADVPTVEAQKMAAGQRPVTEAALTETTGMPAWKTIPSWFIYGDRDKNIPPAALAFMAERADAQTTVVIAGGSHVVMVSNPVAVANLIRTAAAK